MADMMSTLKGFLGDDAEEKIKTAMSMLAKEEGTENTEVKENKQNITIPKEGMEMLMQLKGMADKFSTANDSRSRLLMSLRPFMRDERQRSIDKMVKLMNIGRFSGLFGG